MYNELPASIHILGFFLQVLVSSLSVVLASIGFMLRKRHFMSITQIMTIGTGALVTSIILTPLVDFSGVPEAFFALLTIYIGLSLTAFSVGVASRKPLCFVDGLIFLALSPVTLMPSIVEEWVSFLCGFYFFARCMQALRQTVRYIYEDEGRFMVKAAMDHCAEGVVFADRFDQIYYINPAMNRILRALALPALPTASELLFRLKQRATRTISEHAFILQTEEDYFQINWISRNDYIQEISATNITEEERAAISLRESTEEAEKAVDELRKAVLLLNTEIRKEELSRIKGSVHDTFAQELSILYRYLDNPSTISYASIKKMLEESRSVLSRSTRVEEPIALESIEEMFDLIGLSIQIDGELPSDQERQQVFLQSLKEACTNAVKHADATEVYVVCKEEDGKYTMTITNNGHAPDQILEGNGIKAIRFRLEQIKGEVHIGTSPAYTLTVVA